MTHTLTSEGTFDGVEYVTVLDEGGNPVEYSIPRDKAEQEYLIGDDNPTVVR